MPKLDEVDAPHVASDIYSNLALLHRRQGNTETAEALWRQALALQRTHGHRFLEARTLCNLAVLSQDQGRYDEASKLYGEGITIYREVGNLRGEAHSLQNWADSLTELGQFSDAIQVFAKARQINLRLGNKRSAAVGLTNMAVLEFHRSNYHEALTICDRALAQHREFRYPLFAHFTLWVMAEVNIAQGHFEEAIRICRDTMMEFTRESDPFTWAIFRTSEAKIHRYEARPQKAKSNLGEALEIFQQTGRKDDSGRTLCEMGFLALAEVDPQDLDERINLARTHLEMSSAISEQLRSPPEGFLAKRIDRLTRSVQAAEEGHPLLGGECPDDLPAGLKKRLNSANSPGS
jgi:tetratricopeptide (TPR) repeat protein